MSLALTGTWVMQFEPDFAVIVENKCFAHLPSLTGIEYQATVKRDFSVVFSIYL